MIDILHKYLTKLNPPRYSVQDVADERGARRWRGALDDRTSRIEPRWMQPLAFPGKGLVPDTTGTNQLPYKAFRGAPLSSAASFAAVDGGKCSPNFAYSRRPSANFAPASASSPAPCTITTNSPLR